MKKVLTLLLISVISAGAVFAEDSGKKDNFYLGLGLVADGTFKFSEKPTVNIFAGYGFRVVDGLPLFVGIEGLLGIQKIGEGTSTSEEYTNILIVTPDYVYYGQDARYYDNTVNFWNIDASPRVYASLDLSDMIQGLVYMGLNFNRLTWDTSIQQYDAPRGAPVRNKIGAAVTDNGTLSESPVMFTTGFRVSVSYFYFEYQRLFYFSDKKDVDWNAIGNRMSLGFILRG